MGDSHLTQADAARAARVICVGIAVLDRIHRVQALPGGPGKFFASALEEAGGGPAASGAVAVVRLGGLAALWSRVGDDPAGRAIRDGLAREGVDVAGIRAYPGARSSTANICLDAHGERQIVTFADPTLDPDPAFLPLDELAGAGAVLADMRWPQGAAVALRTAAARGTPGVLDADAVPDPEAAAPLLPLASHVVFSEPGLIAVTGITDPRAALRAVRPRAPGWLAATRGARGAISLDADVVQEWPAFAVHAVDTLGAGDVFHGAFALALAERRPIEQAMRFAAAAAAIKCTRPGGRAGIPRRAEVDRFLEENPP